MQDIRLVGNDGEYLNLETLGGDKFRLVLDDSLRAAVKRDTTIQLDSVSISPREIQDAVRAGSTAEEVSAKHSVPLDYVEKFALTVVDEIGHIIASAQSVRIAIAADRYSEATQLEFGEVVAERIANQGGKNARWSAAKYEGLPWHVTVTFESPNGETAAVWAFDQRKLVLSPENELAVMFSAGDHASSIPTPKLRPIEPVVEKTQVIDLPTSTVVVEEPVVEAPALAVVSSIEELTKASVASAEAKAESLATAETLTSPEPESSPEPLSATADLLEALRKKRAEAAKSEPTLPKQPEAPEAKVEPLQEPVSEASEVEEVPPATVAPAAKKGRPSMPSWDEIVFGTKTDD